MKILLGLILLILTQNLAICQENDDIYPQRRYYRAQTYDSLQGEYEVVSIDPMENVTLESSVIEFNDLRLVGLGFQVVGTVIAIASIKSDEPTIAVVGGVFSGLGLIIELSASSPILRLKKKVRGNRSRR